MNQVMAGARVVLVKLATKRPSLTTESGRRARFNRQLLSLCPSVDRPAVVADADALQREQACFHSILVAVPGNQRYRVCGYLDVGMERVCAIRIDRDGHDMEREEAVDGQVFHDQIAVGATHPPENPPTGESIVVNPP
jgi:hypothetical protein